jgi:hypothetical protein
MQGAHDFGRVAVGAYTLDASSAQNHVHLALLPIFGGVSVRRSRWSGTAWVGAAGVIAPFNLGVEIEGSKAIDGIGVSTPGVDVFTGAGWKVLNGELQLEAGWLFLTMPAGDVSIQGSIGGLHGTLGYRLYFDGRR